MQTQKIVVANSQNLVTKSNALIEASYKLNTIEQKLILTVASFIEPSDKEFKSYTLTVREFSELLGVQSDSKYTELKKITKGLLRKVNDIKVGEDLIQVAWFSSAQYNQKEGTISFKFDPLLKPFFLELKKEFTSYRLGNISKLRSNYSIRLYELLKQYQMLKERTITLEDLRDKLGTEDMYPRYANFKQRIIVPIQKDLKERSDIYFDYEEIKKGRSVHKIRFIIYTNKTNDSVQELINPIPESVEGCPIELKLKKLGVVKETRKELLENYQLDHIERNIAYVEARQEKIKHLKSYVEKAIKNDYASTAKKTKKPIREEMVPEYLATPQADSVFENIREFESFILEAMQLKRRLTKYNKKDNDLTEFEINTIEINAAKELLIEDYHARLRMNKEILNAEDFTDIYLREIYSEVLKEMKN